MSLQGLIRELLDYNLRRGTTQVRTDVRRLLCLLTRDNMVATNELNTLLTQRVVTAIQGHLSNPDFVSYAHVILAFYSFGLSHCRYWNMILWMRSMCFWTCVRHEFLKKASGIYISARLWRENSWWQMSRPKCFGVHLRHDMLMKVFSMFQDALTLEILLEVSWMFEGPVARNDVLMKRKYL